MDIKEARENLEKFIEKINRLNHMIREYEELIDHHRDAIDAIQADEVFLESRKVFNQHQNLER